MSQSFDDKHELSFEVKNHELQHSPAIFNSFPSRKNSFSDLDLGENNIFEVFQRDVKPIVPEIQATSHPIFQERTQQNSLSVQIYQPSFPFYPHLNQQSLHNQSPIENSDDSEQSTVDEDYHAAQLYHPSQPYPLQREGLLDRSKNIKKFPYRPEHNFVIHEPQYHINMQYPFPPPLPLPNSTTYTSVPISNANTNHHPHQHQHQYQYQYQYQHQHQHQQQQPQSQSHYAPYRPFETPYQTNYAPHNPMVPLTTTWITKEYKTKKTSNKKTTRKAFLTQQRKMMYQNIPPPHSLGNQQQYYPAPLTTTPPTSTTIPTSPFQPTNTGITSQSVAPNLPQGFNQFYPHPWTPNLPNFYSEEERNRQFELYHYRGFNEPLPLLNQTHESYTKELLDERQLNTIEELRRLMKEEPDVSPRDLLMRKIKEEPDNMLWSFLSPEPFPGYIEELLGSVDRLEKGSLPTQLKIPNKNKYLTYPQKAIDEILKEFKEEVYCSENLKHILHPDSTPPTQNIGDLGQRLKGIGTKRLNLAIKRIFPKYNIYLKRIPDMEDPSMLTHLRKKIKSWYKKYSNRIGHDSTVLEKRGGPILEQHEVLVFIQRLTEIIPTLGWRSFPRLRIVAMQELCKIYNGDEKRFRAGLFSSKYWQELSGRYTHLQQLWDNLPNNKSAARQKYERQYISEVPGFRLARVPAQNDLLCYECYRCQNQLCPLSS